MFLLLRARQRFISLKKQLHLLKMTVYDSALDELFGLLVPAGLGATSMA